MRELLAAGLSMKYNGPIQKEINKLEEILKSLQGTFGSQEGSAITTFEAKERVEVVTDDEQVYEVVPYVPSAFK